ncbi:unnamed protein product [Arctia plantaginis]|uniref:Uncharacterized protein n=1 Tax=Arctia plantaginis TaxID=874455 RepID=A0A8S1B2H8_ARCPL|nr:unnamed protein product [Arctia plantaginis]
MDSRSLYGRENNAMVNTLKNINRIRTNTVEKVFRAVDRGDYVTPDDRYLAYMQQPWRSGRLHLSAPCIYGEVLEALHLRPGQSFLNIGSGTGYLNTLVGLILGCIGINHGVEVHSQVVDYANEKLEQFLKNSPALDEFDFCVPKFHCGNALCLSADQKPYDRVYCGADCPEEFLNVFKKLIKIGGVLVLPSDNRLLRIERTTEYTWTTVSYMNVAFSSLQLPTIEESLTHFTIEWTCPPRLQILSYAVVRKCMRASQLSRHPRVSEPLLRCPGLTDFDVNELLRHILSMNTDRDSSLPLSGFSSQKHENLRDEDTDHIKSLESISKPLEEENKSELTSKNTVDASPTKTKSTNITQANEDLDKLNSKRTKSGVTTLDTNKELDKLNRALSNTTLATPEQPEFLAQTGTKPNNAKASVEKSVNIIETNKDLQNINGVQGNSWSLFQNLQKPTSDSLKETKKTDLALNNDSDTSGDKEKPVNITETNRDLQTMNEDQGNSLATPLDIVHKPRIYPIEVIEKEQEKKEVQAFNFTPPSQNVHLPTVKFTRYKFTKNKKQSDLTPRATDASENKKQSLTFNTEKWFDNIDSSKVFIFSDSKKDPTSSCSSSPFKTCTQDRAAEACPNKTLNYNIKEVVEKSTSTSPNPVTEPVPAVDLNSTSEVLKDIRLSILVKQGVMEVQLPYEQKELTNITFTKVDDKAMITSNENSSPQPHTSKTSEEEQLANSRDTYKSDIFERLKIALSPMHLTKVVPRFTVRISFKTLNYYTAWIWDSMMLTYDKLDHEHNKAIFQKGALLLAEAKVAYAQKSISHTPNEELRSRKVFTDEELLNLKEMASKLPLPLAAYLECIGNTNNGDQLITPVVVDHPQNVLLSGAPSLMLSLFKQLRFGVPLNGPLYRRARELGLPMLNWEEFPNTTPGAGGGSTRVRITTESFNFWVTTRNGCYAIKWDANDCRTFKRIVLTLDEKKGHNVDFDLSHGMGSLAQLVQTIDYKVDEPTKWLTNIPVDDYSIKLGAAFAFHCAIDEQGACIPPQTYMSGQITPRRVMFAILCSIYHS